MKSLLLLILLTNLLPAQVEPKPIIIDLVKLDEENTFREGLNLVMEAAHKENKFFALNIQLAEAHLEAHFPSVLILRKVPVEVALKYLCEGARLMLSYEEGLWKIQPRSGEEGADLIQVSIDKITATDLAALGIIETPGVGYATADGQKWPPIPNSSASMIEDLLILRSNQETITNFKTLLALHRAGYQVPAIDSNQPAKE